MCSVRNKQPVGVPLELCSPLARLLLTPGSKRRAAYYPILEDRKLRHRLFKRLEATGFPHSKQAEPEPEPQQA